MQIPETLALDIDTLTIGDLEAIEEALGTIPESFSPEALEAAGVKRSTWMVAVAWLALRRLDPSATLDDARSVPLASLQVSGGDGEVDPTERTAS